MTLGICLLLFSDEHWCSFCPLLLPCMFNQFYCVWKYVTTQAIRDYRGVLCFFVPQEILFSCSLAVWVDLAFCLSAEQLTRETPHVAEDDGTGKALCLLRDSLKTPFSVWGVLWARTGSPHHKESTGSRLSCRARNEGGQWIATDFCRNCLQVFFFPFQIPPVWWTNSTVIPVIQRLVI